MGGNYIKPIHGQNYINLLQLSDLTNLWNRYFKLRSSTLDYNPLISSQVEWKGLEDLLGNRLQKRVLVHIKEKAANATILPTDPETYLETLNYLCSERFQLVFVGRERMPKCFDDVGVINYPQSKLASFYHDIALFQSCSFALISGSGIAYLADCYQKPYVYLNSWHIGTPVFSPKAIVVPSLLKKKLGGFLTFKEQIELFLTTAPDGRVQNIHEYEGRNASSDEILAAIHELQIGLDSPLARSSLQKDIQMIMQEIPLYFAKSRYSDYFLRKHEPLLRG